MTIPTLLDARGVRAAVLGSLLMFGAVVGAEAGQNAGARPDRLRILVLEGESGINIVGQGTAVAPIVEVRDRNNQPVGGIAVTFAIRGGHATFNGARTLSVTTNAAGRATVSGLTPTSGGTFQISASAAFQGQTAQVSIAQTNVMTAAQAAQVAGAAGAAGAASAGVAPTAAGAAGGSAAGGGLGALATAGIIGGAVGGGVLVTREVLVGGFTDFQGPFRMEIVETSNSDGPQRPLCTSTLALQGTLTLELTDDNGILGGELVSEWSITEIARTCLNPKGAIGDARRASAVTGTHPSVQVNAQSVVTDSGGTSSNTLRFSGTVNGDMLIGTWSTAESFTGVSNANGTFYSASVPLTSVSVTLRRQ